MADDSPFLGSDDTQASIQEQPPKEKNSSRWQISTGKTRKSFTEKRHDRNAKRNGSRQSGRVPLLTDHNEQADHMGQQRNGSNGYDARSNGSNGWAPPGQKKVVNGEHVTTKEEEEKEEKEEEEEGNVDQVEDEPPYSPRNEVSYFLKQGVPLGLSAVLEWGLPPFIAMVLAGHTPDSPTLQASMGYGRVFYNITMLMPLLGCCQYIYSVLPGCVGAGRRDRIPRYLLRSMVLCTAVLSPMFALQFFAAPLMTAFNVPRDVSVEVGAYSRIMVVAGWLLLLEIHVESVFINLAYVKSATFNSLLTGIGVDVAVTYTFIYHLQLGMKGAAYAQLVVRLSRLLVWAFLVFFHGISSAFITPSSSSSFSFFSFFSSSSSSSFWPTSLPDDDPAIASIPTQHPADHVALPPPYPDHVEPIFSYREWKVFVSQCLPAVAKNLSSWFIFELQIMLLANVPDISPNALAAGAIWVQLESTMASIQQGWIQVTSIRTIKLLGKQDPLACRSWGLLTSLSCAVVALTNLPLFLCSHSLSRLISNNAEVSDWFRKLVWVLALHTQTRILSSCVSVIFIPIGKGRILVVLCMIAFYVIGAPVACLAALTDLITNSMLVKIILCVACSSIAQAFLPLVGLPYLLSLDWVVLASVVSARAHTDKGDSQERLLNPQQVLRDEGLALP
eukprot:g55091.t1